MASLGSPDTAAAVSEPSAAAFPEIELPRAADAVTHALVDGLRAGAAPIGARLPRDYELAARFGVSRSVVRDALDRLRRAGVLRIRRGQGGGAVVQSLEIPTELLTDMTELEDDEIVRLLEARRAIEATCVELAVGRASEGDFVELERLARQLTTTRGDPPAFIELDVRFHLRMAAVSGNRHLHEFLATVFRDLAAARSRYPTEYGSMQAATRLQREMVAALRSRDPALAAERIDEHLRALEEHFPPAVRSCRCPT